MERLTSEGLQVDFQVAVPSAAARREISSGNNTKNILSKDIFVFAIVAGTNRSNLIALGLKEKKKKPLHRSHPQHF